MPFEPPAPQPTHPIRMPVRELPTAPPNLAALFSVLLGAAGFATFTGITGTCLMGTPVAAPVGLLFAWVGGLAAKEGRRRYELYGFGREYARIGAVFAGVNMVLYTGTGIIAVLVGLATLFGGML